jgi:hypothetical protein
MPVPTMSAEHEASASKLDPVQLGCQWQHLNPHHAKPSHTQLHMPYATNNSQVKA